MQELFLSAFKRLLQSNKNSIIENLSNLFESPGLARHAYNPQKATTEGEKRKKSDLISNDTIESDKIRLLQAQNAAEGKPDPRRRNLSFSSFKKFSRKGPQMLGGIVNQEDSGEWDPKEEKKQ